MDLNGLSKEYILMSIKPHYADLIYTERKRFEYRKRAPKLVDLPILLYETAPVQKVTGIIADWSILQASPEAVWTYSKTHSGLTAEGLDKVEVDVCFESASSNFLVCSTLPTRRNKQHRITVTYAQIASGEVKVKW